MPVQEKEIPIDILMEKTFISSHSLEDFGSEASLSPKPGLFGRECLRMWHPV